MHAQTVDARLFGGPGYFSSPPKSQDMKLIWNPSFTNPVSATAQGHVTLPILTRDFRSCFNYHRLPSVHTSCVDNMPNKEKLVCSVLAGRMLI